MILTFYVGIIYYLFIGGTLSVFNSDILLFFEENYEV